MEKGFTITYAYGDNLYVNPTNRCNFNCEFCLRKNGNDGSIYTHNLWLKREPTKEEIRESIESTGKNMEAITVQSAVRKIAAMRLIRRNEKNVSPFEIIDPIANLDPSLARYKEADLIIRLGMQAGKRILALFVFRIHDLVIKLDLRRILRAENRVTISMGHTRSFPMHLLYYSIF